MGNLKSFTLTIPWNSAKLVKICPGIIVRQHLTVQKQMELLREQYAERKKGLLLYWWADSMECCCYLRNIQDLLSDGTLFLPKTCRKLHQFGKKILPGSFVGYVLYAERIWKGDILVADTEELWTHPKSMLGGSTQRKC